MAWGAATSIGGAATTGGGDSGSTVAFQTSVAVSAGNWAFVGITHWDAAATVASVADNGAGLSWEVLTPQGANVETRAALARAYAPSGLASGTTITATFSQLSGYRIIDGVQASGGGADSDIEHVAAATGATAAWSSAPSSVTDDALVIGVAHLNAVSSSTPDGNTTETHDIQNSSGQTGVLCYRLVSATGANPVGGTWASATAWSAVAASFSLVALPVPPIEYIGAGAVATATAATIAPAIPTHAAGDLIVVGVGVKPDTASVANETDWTNPTNGEAAGGGGTTGVDTGPTRVRTFVREATAAGTTITLDLTGQNVEWAQALVFRKTDPEATWDVAAANGVDSTTGSPFTATMGADPGLAADDMVAIFGCVPTDVTTPAQFSAHTLAATGITATVTEVSEPDTTSGNDLGGVVCTATIDSGTSSAAPTVSMTAGGTTTNVRGPIVLVRLRAVSAGGAALSGSAGASAGASAQVTAATGLTGSQAAVGAASGVASAQTMLSASSAATALTTGSLRAAALLSGASSGQSAASGQPTARAAMTASAPAAGTAAGEVTTQPRLDGAAASVGSASGAVSAQTFLTGAAAGTAVATGQPAARALMSGSTSAPGAAVGALTAPALLSGSTAGAGATTGAVTATVMLSGTSAAAGASAGTMTVPGAAALSGSAAATSTVTGALAATVLLTGSSSAAAVATGALTAMALLSGISAGMGATTGAPSASAHLVGATAGDAAATGALSASPRLTASAAGAAIATGNLTVPGSAALSGSAAGLGAVTGQPTTPARVTGSATATGTTSGSLAAASQLTGSSSALSDTTGLVRASPQLAATTAGAGGLTALLTVSTGLVGNAAASGTAVAGVSAATGLLGTSTATGTATGVLVAAAVASWGTLTATATRASVITSTHAQLGALGASDRPATHLEVRHA